MTGKLKTKGNMMLATKLGSVLSVSHGHFFSQFAY
jgi:putative sterol carrier protein